MFGSRGLFWPGLPRGSSAYVSKLGFVERVTTVDEINPALP